MIISLALIIAVALGVSPWALFFLLVTWLPDIILTALIMDVSQ